MQGMLLPSRLAGSLLLQGQTHAALVTTPLPPRTRRPRAAPRWSSSCVVRCSALLVRFSSSSTASCSFDLR